MVLSIGSNKMSTMNTMKFFAVLLNSKRKDFEKYRQFFFSSQINQHQDHLKNLTQKVNIEMKISP